MTTIPRVRDLPDLLTVVPLLAGFTPSDSLVLVCPAPTGRVALQRVCLPPPEQWDLPELDAAQVVSSVLPALLHAGLDRVTLVGYLSDPMDEGYVGALVREASDQLEEAGVEVLAEALVCEGSWWRPDCPCGDPECGEPRPVPSLHESAAATALIADGAMVHSSAEELLLPWVEGPQAEVPADELREAQSRWKGRKGRPRLQREALAQWRRVVHEPAAELTVEELGAALWALQEVQVRDALISWLTPGDVPLEVVDAAAWAAVERALGDPSEHRQPELWTAWTVTANLRVLTSRVPATCAAPLLSVAGLWAWWNGDGVVARFLLERALDAEPGHTLAGLLLRLVHHGIPLQGSRCGAAGTTGAGAGARGLG
ncbi:DUF4192 domain-containing protein [Kytococcus sp. Marseille-QA3725]